MLRFASAVLAGLIVFLLAAAPASPADVRLRGYDPVEALFSAFGPDRVVAGDLVVGAGTQDVFGWSVGGGPVRRLGRLPDLGPATNDIPDGGGFVRVEAAQPGRVVVVRGEGRSIGPEPETGPGHRVVVGPPQGPFEDPAGCGERSGGPAGLSGDLLAYVAAPAAVPACPGGTAGVVTGPSVVVRDLSGGGAVVRTIPLPFDGAANALRFDGAFLGLDLRRKSFDPDSEPERAEAHDLVAVEARSGTERTRVEVRGDVPWDLGPDGALLYGQYGDRKGDGTCLSTATRLRLHPPGDATGRPVPGTACAFAAPELRAGGIVRLSLPLRDGRIRIVDRPLDGTPDRELGIVAGPLVGGDDRHLVVGDGTCRTEDARVVTVGGPPVRPAGPRDCPIRVRAPGTARSGGSVKVRMTCPRGCVASLDLQVYRPADTTTFGFTRRVSLAPGRSATVRFVLPRRAAVRRSSRGRLVVTSAGPVKRTRVRRRIAVLPAR